MDMITVKEKGWIEIIFWFIVVVFATGGIYVKVSQNTQMASDNRKAIQSEIPALYVRKDVEEQIMNYNKQQFSDIKQQLSRIENEMGNKGDH